MNTSSLETTDIFRVAFYLCMGDDLADIRLSLKGYAMTSPVQAKRQADSKFYDYRP